MQAAKSLSNGDASRVIKGAPLIAADPGGFPDFRIFRFFGKMLIFGISPVGFGVWEGLQSIGNGCGLQMD